MEQETQELRAYFFQNFYLQGIHCALFQSQHTTAEMFIKYQWNDSGAILDYEDPEIDTRLLYDWATNHKTSIVLNGGMQKDLEEIIALLESKDNIYPWAYFKEAEFSLNGALTNVGIILPEKIYNYDKLLEQSENFENDVDLHELTDFEYKLVELLRYKKLMS